MSGKRSIDTSEIKIHPDENYKPKKDKTKKAFLDILKKNEAPFIVVGAVLLICVLVYIIFSFTSDASFKQSAGTGMLEERMAFLEKKMAKLETEDPLLSEDGEETLVDRFDRFEATMSLKMSVLERRLENMEKKESADVVSSKPSSKIGPAAASSGQTVASVKKTPPKKVSATTSSQKKSDPVYHKINKGETYYSISRKYSLSVQQLLDLNNLKLNDTIYPGQKLLVKP